MKLFVYMEEEREKRERVREKVRARTRACVSFGWFFVRIFQPEIWCSILLIGRNLKYRVFKKYTMFSVIGNIVYIYIYIYIYSNLYNKCYHVYYPSYLYIYIYIYICVCVCVCVYIYIYYQITKIEISSILFSSLTKQGAGIQLFLLPFFNFTRWSTRKASSFLLGYCTIVLSWNMEWYSALSLIYFFCFFYSSLSNFCSCFVVVVISPLASCSRQGLQVFSLKS